MSYEQMELLFCNSNMSKLLANSGSLNGANGQSRTDDQLFTNYEGSISEDDFRYKTMVIDLSDYAILRSRIFAMTAGYK
jgi:hypothetical protein